MKQETHHNKISARDHSGANFLQPSLEPEKFAEGSLCRDCGAVYAEGRWKWGGSATDNLIPTRCTACQRIKQRQPAGYVTLQGKFASEHWEELVSFVRNFETHAKSENPMQRIMSIDKRAEKLMIATTDTSLARQIGRALHQAYNGSVEFNYYKSETVLRALWQR